MNHPSSNPCKDILPYALYHPTWFQPIYLPHTTTLLSATRYPKLASLAMDHKATLVIEMKWGILARCEVREIQSRMGKVQREQT